MSVAPPPCSGQFVVFSDLDGTLLDHETYEWRPASPALDFMREHAIPLILTSSKTAAEMRSLRAEMGFAHCPAIVENGAGILEAGDTVSDKSEIYSDLRQSLCHLPASLRSCFSGFGDWSNARVAELTGLTVMAAQAAKTRQFSEPGIWSGSPQAFDEFKARLSEKGITVQRGGRFTTLSFGADKAHRMKAVIEQYASTETRATIIALGDAPNDIAMLEAADIGIIIPNPAHSGLPELSGESHGSILRAESAGPLGWCEALMSVFEKHFKFKEQI